MAYDRWDRWSDWLLAKVISPLADPIVRSGSVLRAAADSEAIDRAEERLGVRLPSSYREFLLRSDGAYADMHGAVLERDGPRTACSVPWVGLLPIEDLERARTRVPATIDSWLNEDDDLDIDLADERANMQEVTGSRAALRKALLLTSLTDEPGKFMLCLVPVRPGLDAGGEGWELWNIASDSITRYLTFGAWPSTLMAKAPVFGPPGDYDDFEAARALLDDGRQHPSWVAGYIRSLAHSRTRPDLVEYLAARCADDNPFIRLGAAQALTAHNRQRGEPFLATLATCDEPSVRLGASASLRLLRDR